MGYLVSALGVYCHVEGFGWDHRSAARRVRMMQSPEPHCEVALMLCESLIHLLVEEGVITKERALEAIDGVLELAREMDKTGKRPAANRPPPALIEAMAQSFALKD